MRETKLSSMERRKDEALGFGIINMLFKDIYRASGK